MRSALYEMQVVHHRLHPQTHSLRRRVTMLWLELDELGELGRRLRLFSATGRNLVSFRARDHGACDATGGIPALTAWAEAQLRDAGIAPPGGRIALLCMPRLVGAAFNPISTWFCHRPDGTLGAMLYEVRNTFGGRHCYAMAVEDDATELRHVAEKRLHVSPFMPMGMRYRFRLRRSGADSGSHLTLAIEGQEGGRTLIRAVMSGRAQALTDRALLACAVSRPLQGLVVLAGIHLEALRLWWKGARFHRSPPAPVSGVTAGIAIPKPVHG